MSRNVIFVSTGERKDVFRDLHILNLLNENDTITYLTDRSNFDMFSHFTQRKIIPYEMNAESYIVLIDRRFDILFDFSRTELSRKFAYNCQVKEVYSYMPVDYNENPNNMYYFEKMNHPIDVVHSKLKRDGNFLIGINVGEDEDMTKKIPVRKIVWLMDKLSSMCKCKFVLFGTYENKIRFEMIKRQISVPIISFLGLTEAPVLAQAIGMCDVFISTNSFALHLSLAIGSNTVGIFCTNESCSINDFDYFRKIVSTIQPSCFPCDELEECVVIRDNDQTDEANEYCYNGISFTDITPVVMDFLLKDK